MNALGVDIGGTHTKVALVEATGAANLETFPTGADRVQLVARIKDAARRHAEPVRGAGVAVAGFLNAARDRLSYNPNLEWLVGFPLRDALADALGSRILLEVDSNAACLGEYRFGAGRGSKRFLCLAAGTGLGGAMVVDGALLRFTGECIGDVGHVVVDASGPPCPCGGRGCAEALVSERTIVEAAGAGETLRDVIHNARQGHTQAAAALSQAGRALGIAMASLAQIFAPDRIALAGGLAEAEELVMPQAERSFQEAVNSEARAQVSIVKAALGWRAAVIGAAVPLI
ncbi:MAG TPA: hypothetical protein DEQ47_20390 [Solibacterales bacterium]|nr:hypothetical protein [Bryobacterales bacterium]